MILLRWVCCIAVAIVVALHSASALNICVVNRANNPRTASLFSRGLLEAHGSRHNFTVVLGRGNSSCPTGSQVRLFLLKFVQADFLLRFCTGSLPCILTGDEKCSAPASQAQWQRLLLNKPTTEHSQQKFIGAATKHPCFADAVAEKPLEWEDVVSFIRPNIIARQYYSSKYGDLPALSLGPRFEFDDVSPALQRSPRRPIMFNFMGSIRGEDGVEKDRVHMQDVVNGTNWTVPFRFRAFDELVRTPNNNDVFTYRETLLLSSFTLTPVGTADDTFRFWEAIAAGSIPIFVRRQLSSRPPRCPDAFEDVLRTNPPIVILDSWDGLAPFIESVSENDIAATRARLIQWHTEWWTNTTRRIDDTIDVELAALRSKHRHAPSSRDECTNLILDPL